ncbi:MAG: GNAT family N-acetyltransferase [Candidatus Krumholzibacteriia bacterium]
MANVDLISLDLETCDLLLSEEPEPLAERHRVTLGRERKMLRTIARATREPLARGQVTSRWWGYLTLDRASREAVGACGFKGAPGARGEVEIVCLTLPSRQGKGYATAMTQALLGLAWADPAVRLVVACTRPERDATTHLLEKVGFSFAEQGIDPQGVAYWRWTVARPAAAARR